MASFKDMKQQLSSSLYQRIQCAVQEMLGQVESLVERVVERALLPEDQGIHLDCPGLTSAVSQIDISEGHLRSNEALVAGTSGNTEFSGTGVKVENNQQEQDETRATPSRGRKKKYSEVTQSEVTPHCSDVCGTASAPQVNISQLQLSSNQSLSVDKQQTDPFFDSDDRNETWVKHGTTPSRGRKKKDQKEVTQSEQRLLCCGFCGKGFRYKSKLIIHKRTHTGEKPYQCDVCKKSFTQNGNLKIHNRIHTGEKPYQCDVCKKSFTQNGNLKIHNRIHTGEKPYSCDVCRKAFNQRNHLKLHKCALRAEAMSSAESPAGGATQYSDLRTEETVTFNAITFIFAHP